MTRTIDFPTSGNSFGTCGTIILSIFGFDIAYYGMIIGAGILAGVLMAVNEAERTGQNRTRRPIMIWLLYAVIISIIGARAILCGVFMGYVQR